MGAHKGWRVRQDTRRGTWRGEVWDAERSRYVSRSFADRASASWWAKGEAAKACTGAPSVLASPQRARTEDLARDYLARLAARGRSPAHLDNVRRTLSAVAAVAPDLTAADAGPAIERWIDQEGVPEADRVGLSTRNRRLVEIRALCRWAMRRDLLAKDPTRAIERAHCPDALRAQFTVTELRTLLALPTPGDPVLHRRLALCLYLGLRADEASALTWGDLDLAGGVALVRAHDGHRLKRGRERIVPLPGELRDLLGRPCPLDHRIAAMSDANIRRKIPIFFRSCGLPVAGRSMHSLRHTYAGVMTATGIPGPLLSAYLGHTSAATTMLYTRMAALHVQAVAGWPRGEWRLFGGPERPG